ncbi:NDR1/HIN1-like protein 1 [Salvia hispanica]|uniref:NDR1/HIN1-like protein 1 n=1 Tax=Salvia hispanica TaxID=49212 RepID=UPI002009A3EF|nr:NDR1/HIN1-like protein 1 [Salvia hispanica]
MTSKDCGNHDDHHRKKLYRNIFLAAAAFAAAVLLAILLVWLILRPTKPHFILQDATVFAFNLSGPSLLTATFQITLSARNPNARIGVYYDRLDVYAAYHSQQITLPMRLPPSYQGHKDITVWSPFVYGREVPVAPYLATSLGQDELTGTVLIHVRVDGRVRWKVGTFISGSYHLYVSCPAYINFGHKYDGITAVGSGIKYQLLMDCNVDV